MRQFPQPVSDTSGGPRVAVKVRNQLKEAKDWLEGNQTLKFSSLYYVYHCDVDHILVKFQFNKMNE